MNGFTLWFTGLSGSGKSTLASAIASELEAVGRSVELLDGDVVRQYISRGLGFSKEDRDENIRRIGFAAHLVTRHGGVAITAAISPYRALRDENRKLIGSDKFVEVYCACALSECERRDIKGLYKKARTALAAGQPAHFTGLDAPYEPPLNPEISVDTGKLSVEACTAQILARLRELNLVDATLSTDAKTAANPEFLPEELLRKAEAVLRAAQQVDSHTLVRELHVGHYTALHLLDRLGKNGKLTINPATPSTPRP